MKSYNTKSVTLEMNTSHTHPATKFSHANEIFWGYNKCSCPRVATRQGKFGENFFFQGLGIVREFEKGQMSGKCQGISAGVVRGNPVSAPNNNDNDDDDDNNDNNNDKWHYTTTYNLVIIGSGSGLLFVAPIYYLKVLTHHH